MSNFFSKMVEQHNTSSVDSLKSDTNVLNLESDRSPENSPPLPNEASMDIDPRPTGYQDPPQSKRLDKPPEIIDGVLDTKSLQYGLRNIGKLAIGYSFVFLDLHLPALGIKSIDVISNYVHLLNVNLMHNMISDLTPLNSLDCLVSLNVSNNVIPNLDSLITMKNLRNLDASNNLIDSVGNMSRFPALEKLNLSNNHVCLLAGVSQNKRLRVLNVSSNKIYTMMHFGPIKVTELYIAANDLESVEEVQFLNQLQVLDISYNRISNLRGLENHKYLMKVDVQNNLIPDYDDLEPVFTKNMLLRELNLRNNPIQDKDDYRLAILYRCPELTSLDKHKVQAEEKVSAQNLFNPPPEVMAARDHINHVVYKYLQPARLRECTLPNLETPYPILILCGPEGSGKIELANKLVMEFPDFFNYLPNHVVTLAHDTSIYGKELEQNNISGITPEEFVNLIQEGRFVSTYSVGSRTLGIMYDVIDSIASEGLACVTHMEYEGVLSFKKSFFEPRYLLVLPKTEQVHEDRLRFYYQMTDDEISYVLSRREMYIETNQEKPGFFDQVIDSDNIQNALRTLTSVVREYLGLPPDYVSRTQSSGITRDEKRGSVGGSVVSKSLRYKVSGKTPLMRKEGMTEAELRSLERRESALRQGIREDDLSPESAYGGHTTIYGKPYTAPAALETPAIGAFKVGPGKSHAGDLADEKNDGLESPIERPDIENGSSLRLQERASALLDDDVLLENEIQTLFNKAGKTIEGIMTLDEAKELIKNYFESNLFEFPFAAEDHKKFEVSFESYAETDGRADMSFEEFKGWFLYMLRMIKFGLYANSN